jgi:DNA-directed RNA polymerase beta subunit
MSAKNSVNERISFASIQNQLEYPDFLEIQLKSFMEFFQLDTTPEDRGDEGLYKVFNENFPISDTRNNFVLEFIDYFIDPPRYSIEECIERGLTYSVPLKAKLKLYCTDPEHEDFDTVIQDVYLGTIPYMTERGFSSSMVPNALLFHSSTAHLVCSSDKAFMRMVQNSIQQELSRLKDLGSSLQPTSIM